MCDSSTAIGISSAILRNSSVVIFTREVCLTFELSRARLRRRLSELLGGGVPWLATMSSHLVTKLHHAALIGFDLRQMEGDVSVELLEERYPIANQDRQDRITNFVGQPETKAFAGNYTASNRSEEHTSELQSREK